MSKRVAILQSNYIPWKGYFDMIAAVDEFIIYDDMQFTKNDWRNRNKIKTPKGLEWLSIPVGQNISRRIRDVGIQDSRWQKKHWKALVSNYARSTHFDEIISWLEPLYLREAYTSLSQVNRQFIELICGYLGIGTSITNSSDYRLIDGATERVLHCCEQSGATEYITGPAARQYIDERTFDQAGIRLTWFSYEGYPDYPQLWGPFHHGVTILDLLFNCGPYSPKYMKYVKS